jgi:general L-amino acid transport system permease protein
MTRAALINLARNTKVRALAAQVAIVMSAALLLMWLVGNTAANLQRIGISFGFDFLQQAARFPISESILDYSPSDSFGWAFVVGLGNTLFLALIVIVAATILGTLLALARRSTHPLAHGLAGAAVEVLRNTPLVVQLLFWYALVTVGLPNFGAALNPLSNVYLSDRGLYMPGVQFHAGPPFWTILAVSAAAIVTMVLHRRRVRVRTGHLPRGSVPIIGGIAVLTLLCIHLLGDLRADFEPPVRGQYNFIGGFGLSPEFVAVFAGLVLYTSAFIGEIIRGGIDAISRGQWEAGRAIGFSERQILRLIIMPQALRIIVPPLTSQYVNTIKNTTLALVVGYPDVAFVAATTMNQTGQAVEAILILMLIFLLLSLTASVFMNWFNRQVALVER